MYNALKRASKVEDLSGSTCPLTLPFGDSVAAWTLRGVPHAASRAPAEPKGAGITRLLNV